MHGRGNRYFSHGSNYSGEMSFNQLHGKGRMEWADGRVYVGRFRHNRMVGRGIMRYPNGDIRRGTMENDEWEGEAQFVESSAGEGDEDSRTWKEEWRNGSYEDRVKIFKKVDNDYTSIKVRVVCKAHGPPPVEAQLYQGEELIREGRHDRRIKVEVKRSGEVYTIAAEIPFSDDSFAIYTCMSGEARSSLRMRNPFFIESHGECGLKPGDQHISKNRSKRSALVTSENNGMLGRVVGGRGGRRGEVPWQAIISVQYVPEGATEALGDLCGATLISPWHVLTAAHCLSPRGIFGPFSPKQMTVKLGYTTRPMSLNGEDYGVAKAYVHPEYVPATLANDIALLVLDRKVRIGKYVNPVCLPKPSISLKLRGESLALMEEDDAGEDEDVPPTELVISGFGMTFNLSDISRGWYYPNVLQVSTVKLLPLSSCFSPRQEMSMAFKGHFCAGSGVTDAFREDSCNGDSGGPATYECVLILSAVKGFLLMRVTYGDIF